MLPIECWQANVDDERQTTEAGRRTKGDHKNSLKMRQMEKLLIMPQCFQLYLIIILSVSDFLHFFRCFKVIGLIKIYWIWENTCKIPRKFETRGAPPIISNHSANPNNKGSPFTGIDFAADNILKNILDYEKFITFCSFRTLFSTLCQIILHFQDAINVNIFSDLLKGVTQNLKYIKYTVIPSPYTTNLQQMTL